jgi:RNA polymerase sigma factor (TIGR02999 family)
MSEITSVLLQIEQGDPQAAAKLLPLVYDELRKLAAQRMARENPGQTLSATALVHEAYLRLAGNSQPQAAQWDGRGHFFAAAAEAMRRILVENARRKNALKAGGNAARIDLSASALDNAAVAIEPDPSDLLALEEAIEKLEREDAGACAVAKLRVFAGLSVEEAADALGVSRATGFRHWTYARAFLQAELRK